MTSLRINAKIPSTLSKFAFVNEHKIGKSIVLSILISGRLLSSESDSPRGRNGLRCHQLTDCLKNDAKLLVVFLFQFIEASSQVGVSGEHRPEAHERPHDRSEEHTSELQSHHELVCRLLLEKK